MQLRHLVGIAAVMVGGGELLEAQMPPVLLCIVSGRPRRPGVEPGQPFTADPEQLVIAPVEVLSEREVQPGS